MMGWAIIWFLSIFIISQLRLAYVWKRRNPRRRWNPAHWRVSYDNNVNWGRDGF